MGGCAKLLAGRSTSLGDGHTAARQAAPPRPPRLPSSIALLSCPPQPQVEWVNPADPTKGFKYLFLSPDDYASLMERGSAAGGPAPVKAERLVTEEGEERWQLTGGCAWRGSSKAGPLDRWPGLLLLLLACSVPAGPAAVVSRWPPPRSPLPPSRPPLILTTTRHCGPGGRAGRGVPERQRRHRLRLLSGLQGGLHNHAGVGPHRGHRRLPGAPGAQVRCAKSLGLRRFEALKSSQPRDGRIQRGGHVVLAGS